MNYNKLKVAISAGARAIATNVKTHGANFGIIPNGNLEQMTEISYYEAEKVLLLFADCIEENLIDFETFEKHLENLGRFKIF